MCAMEQQLGCATNKKYRIDNSLIVKAEETIIFFELCCFVVGVFFFPVDPAERFCAEWEGNGGVERCICYCMICHEMVTDSVST